MSANKTVLHGGQCTPANTANPEGAEIPFITSSLPAAHWRKAFVGFRRVLGRGFQKLSEALALPADVEA